MELTKRLSWGISPAKIRLYLLTVAMVFIVSLQAGYPADVSASGYVENSQLPVTTIAGVPSATTGAPVTFSLYVQPGSTPVASTYFRFDDGAQQSYSGPVTVSKAGVTTVTFWSVSENGEAEAKRTVSFTITYATHLSIRADRTALAKYGDSTTIRGTLRTDSVTGAPIEGRDVELRYYRDGVWRSFGIATTSQAGQVAFSVRPRVATTYHLRFAGEASTYGASESESPRVVPRAYLSAPKAPTAVRKSKSFTLTGYLKPRHKAGSQAVRIYKYRRTASGSWKSYGYVNASIVDYRTYSKYSAKLSLSSRGIWRLRAYHPADRGHAASWSKPTLVQACGDKLIALTFDDGPHPQDTPKVLKALRDRNARATFFMLGWRVNKYPSTVRAIARDGHQLGNHRYTHKVRSTEMTTKEFRSEVVRTNKVIGAALAAPTKQSHRYPIVFRYPWGVGNSRTHSVLDSLGMRRYGWTYGPGDGGYQGALSPWMTNIIARRVINNARPNANMLLHDSPNQPNTVAAVPIILKELSRQGYDFVTVQDLRRLRR